MNTFLHTAGQRNLSFNEVNLCHGQEGQRGAWTPKGNTCSPDPSPREAETLKTSSIFLRVPNTYIVHICYLCSFVCIKYFIISKNINVKVRVKQGFSNSVAAQRLCFMGHCRVGGRGLGWGGLIGGIIPPPSIHKCELHILFQGAPCAKAKEIKFEN